MITGASSGIGAIYADRLARRGYDLILVASDLERLYTLATEITNQTRRCVETLMADLADKADLSRVEAVLRTDASITLLLNNVGHDAPDPAPVSCLAHVDAVIALQVRTPTRLAYAVAPPFLARGVGTIITIAAHVAPGREPLSGLYAACRAFMVALSQSLHQELAHHGVRIQLVLPQTPAPDGRAMPFADLEGGAATPLDGFVDAALAALDQGRYAPPFDNIFFGASANG